MDLPLPIFQQLRTSEAIQKYGGKTHSSHGGLWTDLDLAHDILEAKLKAKSISDQEAENLAYFIDNGYVVLDKIIPDGLIDAFLLEQEKIKRGEKTGHHVEYIDNGKHFHGKPFTPDLVGKKFKLIDSYAKCQTARLINLHPNISRFLNLLFEQPALAFQSLNFFTGSGQSIHQDTTYVRVDSPMNLVATWIALEDIKPNTGELEFYSGSHRLPDFEFPGNPGKTDWFAEGQSKWFDRKNFEVHRKYIEWLSAESERRNLEKKRFMAKKGDVLFWTNDFAHGGSPSQKKEHSRLSLVTHYCPIQCNPYYFYTRMHSQKIQHDESIFYAYVDHNSQQLPIGFNDNTYLRLNLDVAKAGMNARLHYCLYGKNEKRPYK
jgi:phytanoyl-CoA hydroxylase